MIPVGIVAAIVVAVIGFLHTHRATALTAKDNIVLADFDNKTCFAGIPNTSDRF
jgi:hypothetical protein